MNLEGGRVGRRWTLSVEARKNISEGHKGEKNYRWLGDSASYETVHQWVFHHFPKIHDCEHCGNKDLPHRHYQWANKDHKYRRIAEDWMRLCAKCHEKYDVENKLRNKFKK